MFDQVLIVQDFKCNQVPLPGWTTRTTARTCIDCLYRSDDLER